MRRINSIFKRKKNETPPSFKSYFVKAKTWADDIYTEAIVSRNRYRLAWYWSLGLISLMIIMMVMMLPLEHTALVVVHHTDAGTVWVEPVDQAHAPVSQAEVESEIIRYVINRESYSPDTYTMRYSLVNLLSDRTVAKAYQAYQSSENPKSVVNRLGRHTIRHVHVENILFLDHQKKANTKAQHHNLAQVNFTVTDRNQVTGKQHTRPWVALISWTYRGTPSDPISKWRNWDGFTVTHYSIEQRSL